MYAIYDHNRTHNRIMNRHILSFISLQHKPNITNHLKSQNTQTTQDQSLSMAITVRKGIYCLCILCMIAFDLNHYHQKYIESIDNQTRTLQDNEQGSANNASKANTRELLASMMGKYGAFKKEGGKKVEELISQAIAGVAFSMAMMCFMLMAIIHFLTA